MQFDTALGQNYKNRIIKTNCKDAMEIIIINTRQHISMGKRPCQADLISILPCLQVWWTKVTELIHLISPNFIFS